jgi:hypothetical protein
MIQVHLYNLESSILLSNKDFDNIDNSITLILTDDRRSINRHDSVVYDNIMLINEKDKNLYSTDIDYFLKNNGFNNIKI